MSLTYGQCSYSTYWYDLETIGEMTDATNMMYNILKWWLIHWVLFYMFVANWIYIPRLDGNYVLAKLKVRISCKSSDTTSY